METEMETETCSHCGLQIGNRELRQIKIVEGKRHVFHGKKSAAPGCKEKWEEGKKTGE
jgi:hypothetical protein